MSCYRLIHLPSGQSVAVVERAEGWWAKGWGVLGRRALPAGDGLWLPGVASVHTLGVRFPLDLLFLNEQFEAVKIARETPPGRWLVRAPGACHTVELGSGTLLPSWDAGEGWCLERLVEERCFVERKESK